MRPASFITTTSSSPTWPRPAIRCRRSGAQQRYHNYPSYTSDPEPDISLSGHFDGRSRGDERQPLFAANLIVTEPGKMILSCTRSRSQASHVRAGAGQLNIEGAAVWRGRTNHSSAATPLGTALLMRHAPPARPYLLVQFPGRRDRLDSHNGLRLDTSPGTRSL